jgi:hypothetical protein
MAVNSGIKLWIGNLTPIEISSAASDLYGSMPELGKGKDHGTPAGFQQDQSNGRRG